MPVPSFKDLMNPTLSAIRQAGGSASIGEIAELIIQKHNLPESVTNELHGDGPQTELEYRLGWARTYLKRRGLLTNSVRGVWALTSLGVSTPTVDPDDVAQEVRRVNEQSRDRSIQPDGGDGQESWQEQLIELLLEMSPDASVRTAAPALVWKSERRQWPQPRPCLERRRLGDGGGRYGWRDAAVPANAPEAHTQALSRRGVARPPHRGVAGRSEPQT